MIKYIIFLIFSLSLILSQSYKVQPPIVDINGVIFKENDEIPYTGKITVFWGNNRLKEEGIYREGVKSGLWKYWYATGKLFSKGIFRNGLKTGVWIEWHENGNKKTQSIYRNGLKNGREINWSLEEVKLSEFSFQSGSKKPR